MRYTITNGDTKLDISVAGRESVAKLTRNGKTFHEGNFRKMEQKGFVYVLTTMTGSEFIIGPRYLMTIQ